MSYTTTNPHLTTPPAQALALADKFTAGAPDKLLEQVVEHSEDKTEVWRFIRRLRDKHLAATLVLKYLSHM